MHIFFSGIGGTGIGPLALIAKAAGYEVSGSDKQASRYIEYLKNHGIADIQIDQSYEAITRAHDRQPIDWYVYSSAVTKENPDHPELKFVQDKGIKQSKRDEFLNIILKQKNLKLVAVAGTHGKTTTTAMLVWLFKQLATPVSYSVGAKIDFGDMGEYHPDSQYFIYECDEFDRNFLAFHPFMSVITGVSWDHHEIFPTIEDYDQAFRDFLQQSQKAVLWLQDDHTLKLNYNENYTIIEPHEAELDNITLAGLYNRQDAWLAMTAVNQLTSKPIDQLVSIINRFPGVTRRMEAIVPNLYSDYAHTHDKIRGAMSVALETAAVKHQKVVVIYEPLTNRRMHFTKALHHDVFKGVDRLYWVPSYLAREDPGQTILAPEELIKFLDPDIQQRAESKQLDEDLAQTIQRHLDSGDLVMALSGGGGGSLDEWLREKFKKVDSRQ